MEKGSGILLHISSLPSPYGCGSFGLEAKRFVKYLKLAGQKYWQLLPINPTTYGDSPYQSPSTFAINPYFIDLDMLKKKGYLSKEEIKKHTKRSNNRKVDYAYLWNTRYKILRLAYVRLFKEKKTEIMRFLKKERYWLEDHALFMAIKNHFDNVSWLFWPHDIKLHKKEAINKYKEELKDDYFFYVTLQYIAHKQYLGLRKFANRNGVKIIGDMPIYVALDSSDVWAHRNEFMFDKRYNPSLVAGVPPDYFSKTGQLWGNPLYDYEKMEKNHFKWWRKRIKKASQLFDVIRIDHFRGFSAFYGVKNGSKTAEKGIWIDGPKNKIIDVINESKGISEIIAEDLGIIDDEVIELLEYSSYPGLKVLQFAFSSDETNPFLPHNYESNCVAYLGTHDNDVMTNFIEENEDIADKMSEYFACKKDELIDKCIEGLMLSNAKTVVFQIQDVLKLDGRTRMNTPGTSLNNWQFRLLKKDLTRTSALSLYELTCQAKRY